LVVTLVFTKINWTSKGLVVTAKDYREEFILDFMKMYSGHTIAEGRKNEAISVEALQISWSFTY